jgi:putative endonuclease
VAIYDGCMVSGGRPSAPSTVDRGFSAQRRAERLLIDRGHRVLERNFRCAVGELDLICADGDELVFVEVRSRASARYGSAIDSVDYRKRRRLSRVAAAYLSQVAGARVYRRCRFDIVGVTGDHVEVIVDAFRPEPW